MGMSSFLYLNKDEQPPDDAAGVAVVTRCTVTSFPFKQQEPTVGTSFFSTSLSLLKLLFLSFLLGRWN